jgi:16S rRNA processing protein RimM
MKINQLVQVGYILKPHGVRGVLKFIADYDFPDDFLEINALFIEQGNTQRWKISRQRNIW